MAIGYIESTYAEVYGRVTALLHNNPNEHVAEIMGLSTGLNQYAHLNSSPRLAMWGSHASQMITIEGAEPRNIYSGIESQYGRATWSVKAPTDGIVVKVIPKFHTSTGYFANNPETDVIFQRQGENASYDVFTIKQYHIAHQNFGFKFDQIGQKGLREGALIFQDDVYARSPNVLDDTDWKFGRHIVVANMSIPQVIEDGVVFCREELKHFRSTILSERTASVGKTHFLLNIYGDANNYKPFPDTGERTHEDGLLFAMREFDPSTAAIDMDNDSLTLAAVDVDIDKLIYAHPNALVYDIDIRHAVTKDVNCAPIGTDVQMRKYWEAQNRRADPYIKFEEEVFRKNKHAKLSPELSRLILRSIDQKATVAGDGVKRSYRAAPLEEWTIVIKYQQVYEPNIGAKISGMHGDKSIIVDIWDRERMPVDPVTGRRAGMISAGNTTIGRMNVGRLVEPYLAASRWHVEQAIQNMTDDEAERYLVEYLSKASPFAVTYLNNLSKETVREYVKQSRVKFRYPIPPNSPNNDVNLCGELQELYPVHKGPLQYIDANGVLLTTEDPILLGEQYIIMSEKNGVDWAAVSGDVKAQIYGPPAKLSNMDKYSYPYRRQATKATAEAELKSMWACCGSVITARIAEIPNNPLMREHIGKNLLSARYPSNIDSIINDAEVKPGFGRPTLLAKHLLACSGIQYGPRLKRID